MQERRVERVQVAEPPVDGQVATRTERVVETGASGGMAADSHDAAHDHVVTAPPAAAVDQHEATAYDPYAGRRGAAAKLAQASWLIFGIIEGLLAIRFILKLLGANEAAGFASFIYNVSAPLVAPFNDLFATTGAGGNILELNTLVAMVVYMLAAWIVAKLVWLVAGENRSAMRTVSSGTRARVD